MDLIRLVVGFLGFLLLVMIFTIWGKKEKNKIAEVVQTILFFLLLFGGYFALQIIFPPPPP